MPLSTAFRWGFLTLVGLGTAVAQPVPRVVINEIVPSNNTTLADENGDSSDWFELYNAGPETVDLSGWGLSDSAKQPFKWVLREASLAPGGFMTIFASGKDRQPGAVNAVNPAEVGGLKLWLAADQIQTGDATQVRISGGAVFVRKWVDHSGRGNHASQASSTLQPLLIREVANGHSALRFDGSNDILTLARPLATNSFTLFAVFRTSTPHEIDPESSSGVGGVSGQQWLFGAQHGGDFNGGSGLSVGINGLSVYEHGSGYMPALAVYAGELGTRFTSVAVTYADKLPLLDSRGSLARTGVRSLRAQVTSPVEIGAGAYGAFNGDLAEALLYDRALDEQQRRAVEQYLAQKYALGSSAQRHTNFKLSSGGETVILTRPDGLEADRVTFGGLSQDVSIGRKPDGSLPWLFFPQPTPGAPNSTEGASELLPSVEFSAGGGFYTNSFELILSVGSPDATIRYTLDGSEPRESSTPYSTPLLIRSRAGQANGISKIPTVPGGQPPVGEVFKGTVVRARAFKPGALSAETVTQSYFVDARGRARYTLPVFSLTTTAANFFDPATGIYVPGNAPNGNYSQRGPDWERPIFVEMFETNGNRVLAQEAGVTIHGNTSQNFAIKGLDFNASGGRGRKDFRYRLFPDRDRSRFGHFLLRPSGHDQMYALMRDEMSQSLMHEVGAEAQAARACVTFVNGEYWGLSYLKEKEDDDFVAHYGNVPINQIDYLEGYAVAKAGDTAHYDDMISFFAAKDLKAPSNYAQAQGMMEVNSYIDYKAAEIFNYRWDIGNHRLWRPRSTEGRWRWLQFDNDVGWGGFWAVQPAWDFNMLEADYATDGSLYGHNNETTTFLLRRLTTNDEFKNAFITRFADLLNSVFLPTNTISHINAFAAALDPEMAEHARRWRAPSSLSEWRSSVQYLRDFANKRPAAIRKQLTQKFGLSPTATVRVAVSDPDRGSAFVNSLQISSPASAPWAGLYFKNMPITFNAVPAPGYRFGGWAGVPAGSESPTTLKLTGDLSVTALFTPEILSLNATREAGTIWLSARGPAGLICALETSTDLREWESAQSIIFDADGGAVIPLPANQGDLGGFYRLRFQ